MHKLYKDIGVLSSFGVWDQDSGAVIKSNSQSDAAGAERPATEPVGLIGLGPIGMTLAERLPRGGFDIWGHDIDPSRDDLLRRAGGKPASITTDVAAGRHL